MTSATRSRLLANIHTVCAGGNKGSLCLKTENFHRQMKEPDFRDYHLLLDEQAEQIFAITDDVAQRARKIG